MAISVSNAEVLSDNGATPWIPLRRGLNSISVSSAAWDAGTVAALEQSDEAEEVSVSPVKIAGVAVELAANDRIMVYGPGYIRMAVTGYLTSDPITLKRNTP